MDRRVGGGEKARKSKNQQGQGREFHVGFESEESNYYFF